MTWPEVTCPEVTLTGSDRKYVLRMPGFPPAFFLTIAVVQVQGLPEMTEGHVTPSGFPCMCACATRNCAISVQWNGVRMRNIRPKEAFWPELTLWNVTFVVTEGHPKGVEGVCACITSGCAISALVGSFHRKWRYETSPRSDRRKPEGGWKGCAHAQPVVAQYPP